MSGWQAPTAEPVRVLRPFAAPPGPYARGHRGVDLAASAASPVRAAGPGAVVFAGRVAARAVVSIEHDRGLRTTYEPVVALVAVGRRVRTGEVVGVLSPGHCGPVPCLHWGLRRGREYLDPMTLLRPSGRPVLLPFLSGPAPANPPVAATGGVRPGLGPGGDRADPSGVVGVVGPVAGAAVGFAAAGRAGTAAALRRRRRA